MREKIRYSYLEIRTEKESDDSSYNAGICCFWCCPQRCKKSRRKLQGDCGRGGAFHLKSDMEPGMVSTSLV